MKPVFVMNDLRMFRHSLVEHLSATSLVTAAATVLYGTPIVYFIG